MPQPPDATRSGFTLLEILLAVTILLLLAGMVLPAYQDSVENAEAAAVRQTLERTRTAIEYYAFQHDGQVPGWDGASWTIQSFLDQLRLASDAGGNVAPVGTVGYPYGPYLKVDIGENPFNGLDSILLVVPGDGFSTPDDSTGWVYYAETGDFRANTTETTPGGTPVWEL